MNIFNKIVLAFLNWTLLQRFKKFHIGLIVSVNFDPMHQNCDVKECIVNWPLPIGDFQDHNANNDKLIFKQT